MRKGLGEGSSRADAVGQAVVDEQKENVAAGLPLISSMTIIDAVNILYNSTCARQRISKRRGPNVANRYLFHG